MNMSPIKKIILGLAAVSIVFSIVTANNLTTVMMIMSSRKMNAGSQNGSAVVQQQNDNQQAADNSASSNDSSYTDNNTSSNDSSASNGGSTSTNSSASNGGSTSTDSSASNNGSASNNSGSSNNASNSSTPAGDSGSSNAGATTGKPSSKAEIVEYFNKASNNVKTSAKSVTKVKEENYQAQDINLGSLGMLQGAVSKLINDNMGVNEEQSGRTGTSVADKNAIYPVENEAWSSKLTVDDIKDATCTEQNGVYTITITVKDDELAAQYAHGTGHHGKAFNIIMPQTIKDNAGPAASLLSSLKVGYQGGKIVATVDAKTGNITSAKYDYVWLLNVDVAGGVTAYFGIKTDFTVKW